MPDWLTVDNAIFGVIFTGIVTLAGYLFNKQSRREELSATDRDNLVKRLGEQVDRLDRAQQHDRLRIDWLEDELWSERKHGHRLHRALGTNVDWGEDMVRWAAGDQSRPHPSPPDFVAQRELLDTPRPRRPPPDDRDAT